MIPGEFLCAEGEIEINEGATRLELEVINTGDRPVQVGSHVHFPQANTALRFDREAAHGLRLDIAAGTAVRFEPGIGQRIRLVPIGGSREVHGLSLTPPGHLGPVGRGPVGRGPVGLGPVGLGPVGLGPVREQEVEG